MNILEKLNKLGEKLTFRGHKLVYSIRQRTHLTTVTLYLKKADKELLNSHFYWKWGEKINNIIKEIEDFKKNELKKEIDKMYIGEL